MTSRYFLTVLYRSTACHSRRHVLTCLWLLDALPLLSFVSQYRTESTFFRGSNLIALGADDRRMIRDAIVDWNVDIDNDSEAATHCVRRFGVPKPNGESGYVRLAFPSSVLQLFPSDFQVSQRRPNLLFPPNSVKLIQQR
jgi:hypothetical protein